MAESLQPPFVVGLDAGGTRIRAYLGDAAGRELGSGHGGPGNALSVPRPELVRNLAAALDAAVPGALRGQVAAVAGGFAGSGDEGEPDGGGHGAVAAAVSEALAVTGIDGARVAVYGDADIVLASAPGAPADGLILIAGTGAIAARVTGRRRVRCVDGDGWLLGDAGSAFWLGREAVRTTLRAADGRGPWTALTRRILETVAPGTPAAAPPASWAERGRMRNRIATWAYSHPPVTLASLSPLVAAAADEGDASAHALLDAAADELAASIGALEPGPGELLAMTGGLAGPGGPLRARVTARAEAMGLRVAAVRDGGAGALALARLLTHPRH
ncbi:N-acetylglucosamine kinase [Streptomyces sp. NPDC059009]|uniref:N-acetylglucosamine kinase n=1 Tax=Streptomyces sp. NPDC059009 TaxID=3346694 RepID=UPI0036A00EE8